MGSLLDWRIHYASAYHRPPLKEKKVKKFCLPFRRRRDPTHRERHLKYVFRLFNSWWTFSPFFFCERSGWNWSIVDEILPCLVEILDRDRTQIGPRQKWFFLWLLFCSAFIPLSLANLPLVTTSRSRSTCRRLWWWSIELHSAHMTDLYTHTRPFLSHWTVCKSFSLVFDIPKGLFIQRIPFRSNNVTRWPFKTIFQISAPFLVLVFFFFIIISNWLASTVCAIGFTIGWKRRWNENSQEVASTAAAHRRPWGKTEHYLSARRDE